jgi:hypothetical protein
MEDEVFERLYVLETAESYLRLMLKNCGALPTHTLCEERWECMRIDIAAAEDSLHSYMYYKTNGITFEDNFPVRFDWGLLPSNPSNNCEYGRKYLERSVYSATREFTCFLFSKLI